MHEGSAHKISFSHPERFKEGYPNHWSECGTSIPCRDRPDGVIKIWISSVNIEVFGDDGAWRGYHGRVKTNQESDQAAHEELSLLLVGGPVERVLSVSVPCRIGFLFLDLGFVYDNSAVFISNIRPRVIQ